jgi:oxalate decarboxylase
MNQGSDEKNDGRTTRRGLFNAASLTAAGIAAASLVAPPEAMAIPHKGAKHEPLQKFKFDIESSEGWEGQGGSAKEATVEEFPVSESIAGVSMRLKPGGLRELHWHAIAAEWAYVLKGRVRATVISPNGQAEQSDFGPGDVWYFPKGHGHALQCLGPEDSHFLLVFDDGHFSEFGTFSITDWIARTQPAVAARNLGLPESVIASLPKSELYIGQGAVPPAAPEDMPNGDRSTNQFPHKYRLGAATPQHVFEGGEIRIVSSKEFPIQTTVTGALQDLKPGALREMHWHPNADEWQYYISGRSRVTIFGAHGRVATEEFGPGQVAFIKQGFGHHVEQIGSEPTQFLAMFNSPVYEEISLSTWLAGNPPSMIADNFGISKSAVEKMPKSTFGIIG